MATLAAQRSGLYYNKTAGGLPFITDARTQTGNVFFVDSAVGVDAAGYGSSPDKPVATIDYAIGLCTADQGDVILVLPGHSETVSTAITCDIADVKIIGLGNGANRPSLTGAAVIDAITITADDVLIQGLRFVTPSAAVTALINVAAARAVVRDCIFELGANIVDAVTITADGELPTFEDNEVIVSANGPDSWLKFEGVIDRPIIRRNHVIGCDGTNPFDDGVFDFNNQAVTNAVIVNNVFGDGNQAVTVFANGGNVVGEAIGPNSYAALAVNADNTGVTLASFANDSITADAIAANAIDAGAIAANAIAEAKIAAGAITAAKFAAGAIDAAAIATDAIDADAIAAGAIDAAAIADGALDSGAFASSAAEKICDGFVVTKAASALPQTDTQNLFTVTGLCLVKRLVGYVTVQVGAVANGVHLSVNPAGAGATTAISGAAGLELNGAAVGSRIEITGTFANPAVKTVDVPLALVQAANIVVPAGTIDFVTAGNDGGTGRIQWSVTYVPLEAGAKIEAA